MLPVSCVPSGLGYSGSPLAIVNGSSRADKEYYRPTAYNPTRDLGTGVSCHRQIHKRHAMSQHRHASAFAAAASLLFLLPATTRAAPTPEEAGSAVAAPLVTPGPTLVKYGEEDDDEAPTRVMERRDLGDYFNSITSEFGDDVSSFFFSGIPEWFQDLPTGEAVLDALDVDEAQMDPIPTSVLNLP